MGRTKKPKKEELTKEQLYSELDSDIVDFFNERLNEMGIPLDMKLYFQANKKQKVLIKMTKIQDHYSVILDKDILISVNPDYFDNFRTDDESINVILFDQCIDLIKYDLEKGSIKIGKTNFAASECIIKKYTYDNVQRAVEVERLFGEQKADNQ